MNITILCVGKLKEKYWRDAEAEYSKRLKRFVNLQITELIEACMEEASYIADPTVDEILGTEAEAYEFIEKKILK